MERLLEHWDALKVFFKEEQESAKKTSSYASTKAARIFEFVRSPTNRLYLVFLIHAVADFKEFLLKFQSDEPQIHQLKAGMQKLLTTVLGRFVKPAARRGKDVLEVSFEDPDNCVRDEDLCIGEEARSMIEDKQNCHLRESRIAEFYGKVRLYYIDLCTYLKSRLPLSDEVLAHAEVADVTKQDSSSLNSLRFFLKRYPCLLPPETTTDTVLNQFNEYQGTDVTGCADPLPLASADETTDQEKCLKTTRLDKLWKNIGESHDLKALSLVMRGILTIPHGSAHCERIFSCVRKVKTPDRSCMSGETLESVLVLKSVEPVQAVQNMTDAQLDAVKSAYTKSLSKP